MGIGGLSMRGFGVTLDNPKGLGGQSGEGREHTLQVLHGLDQMDLFFLALVGMMLGAIWLMIFLRSSFCFINSSPG